MLQWIMLRNNHPQRSFVNISKHVVWRILLIEVKTETYIASNRASHTAATVWCSRSKWKSQITLKKSCHCWRGLYYWGWSYWYANKCRWRIRRFLRYNRVNVWKGKSKDWYFGLKPVVFIPFFDFDPQNVAKQNRFGSTLVFNLLNMAWIKDLL